MEKEVKEVPGEIAADIEAMLDALKKTLSEKFPFGIPRKEIGRATGNVLHPRTCANDDCAGTGVPGRFKIGRNTIYPVQSVIQKIKSKMALVA